MKQEMKTELIDPNQHPHLNNKMTSPPPLLMNPTPTKAALKATVPLPGEKINRISQQPNQSMSQQQSHQQKTNSPMTSPQATQQQNSPTIKQQQHSQKEDSKKSTDDDFDIESEITPSFIMKKCESKPTPNNRAQENQTKQPKSKKNETESEINLEYFSSTSSSPSGVAISTNKEKQEKQEEYDEWLCIQKELSLSLAAKDEKRKEQKEAEFVENLPGPSPKSVEKQLDEIMGAASPLAELFNSPESTPQKSQDLSVENQLEALFDDSNEETEKEQVDLVETRLERLFQGTAVGSDESALDNASFLYKSTDISYDILHQIPTTEQTPASVSGQNKRQWTPAPNPSCELQSFYGAGNSKRPCMAGTSGTASTFNPMDSKWMMDDESAFDFAVDEQEKRHWNGDISTGKLNHQIGMEQHHYQQTTLHQQMLHTTMTNDMQNHTFETDQHHGISFDDDINQQVQNAIDSILNLQGGESDSLHFSLDQTMGSFLESSPSNVSTRPMQQSLQQMHAHHYQQQHNMTQAQVDQLQIGRKRKYTTRLDDIGDCLIGGGNSLDDSPSSSLTLSQTPPSVPSNQLSNAGPSSTSGASIHGEFGVVNNMIDDPVKSIITS
jgi:hypothetical protein